LELTFLVMVTSRGGRAGWADAFNWRSRAFTDDDFDILDHCCFAWNKIVNMAWENIAIGTRDCASGS
jgi:hypothetical protein